MRRGTVRRAVAAGYFYPADPGELARTVDGLLAGAGSGEPGVAPARIVIVPHAGYRFSGPIAASAYARGQISTASSVVLLGPAHFVPLHGAAVPAADAWSTPLGDVAVDGELRAEALGRGAAMDDGPHEPEHALEVQLPFLQRILREGFRVLPVAVGAAEPGWVADLVKRLRERSEAPLVLVSTDLSHYHDAETARTLDRRTADAVVERDHRSIRIEDACGVFALRGIVELARRDDLEIRLLDLRCSADTAGDPWSVVGYGAFEVTARPL